MVSNPESATKLFLPPLKPGASVGMDGHGQWQRSTNVTFDSLANSLALPDGRETGNVCSIPDIWARPLWVEMMLTDNSPHPLRPAFQDQWKGMLAAIALAEVQGFDLCAKFLDLTGHPQDKLISSLLELIPDQNRSVYSLDAGRTNPWTKIFLFLWNDRPVGMTSPSTLLCPSADGDWTGLPWWQEGKLRSPLTPEDHLTQDEKIQLWLWLDNLKAQVETCSKESGYVKTIKELVNEFQTELETALGSAPAGQRLRYSKKANYFGVPIDGGPLKAFNTPIGEKAMPSSVQLMPRMNIGQKALYIIPDRQTLLDQWIHKKQKDIWIYDTSLVNFNLEEFKRKLKANEDYLCVADIFLKDFYFIEEANQLPGGLMPQGYENVTYLDSENNEHHLTPLLPINPQLLNYFTPEELISKIELKPTQIGTTPGVQVSLTLPLSEGEYRIEREYPIIEDHALNEVPVLEVWPNFQAPGWREYYAFYYFKKVETEKTFRVQFPNVEAVHPPVIDDFQLSRLPNFPGFVTCQSEEYPDLTLGVILLQTPPRIPDGNPNKTWTVGIDFGTSFTNVYYSINNTARPLELSPLNLQVTAIMGGKRSSLLYQYFFSPVPQKFPLATVLTTLGTRGQQELIFDGRIYIPESQNLDMFNPEHDDIKTDLKWKRDNLNDNQRFLEDLALVIAAEATKNQVRILRWTFSYPSSFSPNDKSQYRTNWQRIIEDLPNQTGLQSDLLPENQGEYYRSESVALAHYFDAQEEKDLLYTTCIDMGGGSSDISIWVGRQLIHQCSVLLAGNLLFSQFFKQKPRFVQQQFKINIDSLASGNKEEAFYAKLNAVLSGKGEEWLRKQRGLIDDDPDLQYILQRTAMGISGLYYYVGSILQALHLEGRYTRQDNTPVYIGGNGCRILHWLSPGGLFDSDCEAHRLFSRMLSKGSSFPDRAERTVLSSQPKAEVACGLVLDQNATRLQGLQGGDGEPFAGEDCLVNGEEISWSDRLQLPQEVNTFEVAELTYLESFLEDFHQALTDLRIQSIQPLEVYRDERRREGLLRDTKRTLDVKLMNMTGNVNNIRKEPPFILELKALLENIR
ncbi:hypothetical protein [Limnospira platensis]|uniref:hypothetical protein n=1 Tax=Limnospira platensis TaxID=118562 RepID=UPI003D6EE119